MHMQACQFNPNEQMNAIYAARAGAGMAAARTRRKLIFSASALASEVYGETDCVVRLSGEDARQDQSNQQDSQSESGRQSPNTQIDSEDSPFSDWA